MMTLKKLFANWKKLLDKKHPTNRHTELVSGSAQYTDAAVRLRLVRTGSQPSPSVLTFPLSNKFGMTIKA